MTLDQYKRVFESINSPKKCANCGQPDSHSAPFCPLARARSLPCQICMGRGHSEPHCEGPPGYSRAVWALHVSRFLGRVGKKAVTLADVNEAVAQAQAAAGAGQPGP